MQKVLDLLKTNREKDFFVHVSVLNGSSLAEGQRVEFETRQGKKGMEAFNG